jgi:DNA-binding winged helix-turn-helix (wHTH) protein/TolB-like protein
MTGAHDAGERYRFGVFEFDAGTLELRKHDRRLRIRPQSLKLLKLLLAASGEPVPREKIHATLWGPDVFVDFEQGVNHCIKQLRRAFGDDAATPRYIETLPRLGYRFVAPFERLAGPAAPPPEVIPVPSAPSIFEKHGWAWVAGALAVIGLVVTAAMRSAPAGVTASVPPSLAVLPFETQGFAETSSDVGVSLADSVIARLSAGGRVAVRPISAVLRYRNREAAVREIGQTLGVDYVLQGTVNGQGDQRRVALTLADASGREVWHGDIDGRADDLQRVEQEVVQRVLAELKVRVAASEGLSATSHPLAHQSYLEGRYYLSRFTGPDTQAAIRAFERALAMDGDYALAHAGLATASAQMYIRFGSEQDIETWKSRAEQHAGRALQLDSRLAEAHEALAALARYTEIEWGQVVDRSFQALGLNPGLDLPHYYLASALQHIGRLDLVETEVVAGLEANPLNLAEAFRLRGVAALWGGRFQDARTHLEHVRELTAKPVADAHLAAAIYYGGDAASAETMLADLVVSAPSAQSEQRASALLASLRAARGDRAGALSLIDQVKNRRYRDHHVVYSLGAAYAGLGQVDDAMQWLQEAARTGFLCVGWYERDPLLKPVRESATFGRLMAQMKQDSNRIADQYLVH